MEIERVDLIAPDISLCFKELSAGKAVVLTPNNRLSRDIVSLYGEYARGQGANAYKTPSCFPLSAWLQSQWQKLLMDSFANKTVLTSEQELFLWQQVIESHESTPPLLNIPATARLASDAWRLLNEWCLTNIFEPADDLFFQWAAAFIEKCESGGFLSPVKIMDLVIAAIDEKQLTVPEQVFLYGVDEPTPLSVRLFEAMKVAGANVSGINIASSDSELSRYEFFDEEQEIEAAAVWAKSLIEKSLARNEKPPRIGIVAPKLASQKQQIECIFTRIFEPYYIFSDEAQHAPGFNFSAGQPMSSLPVIDAALATLKLMTNKLSVDLISKILRSPFVGIQEEAAARSFADIRLRDFGEVNVSLSHLKSAVATRDKEESEPYCCRDMRERLSEFDHKSHDQKKKKLYPSEWAAFFTQQLAVMNWPGNRKLDTLEYQQVNAWLSCLEAFTGCDHVVGQLGVSTAIQLLQQQLQAQSFQAQTRQSPVQILGVLEAAGLRFDYLWVMNLDDETWPPAPSPNPLLPIQLQVENNLPQSSAKREHEYASRLLKRFSGSAPLVFYSSAQTQGDQQLQPSPLIQNVPLSVFKEPFPESNAKAYFDSQNIETLLDDCGPPLETGKEITGGSQIIKSQAACPFQAFARYRLFAKGDIAEPENGLSSLERGNLVHRAMEVIWRQVRTYERLLDFSTEALAQTIASAVDTAIEELKKTRYLGQRLLRIEKERVVEQISAWMEMEKRRKPFKVVFNEQEETLRLGKMLIHLRYDRVDEMPDGSLFVLDYKTSDQKYTSWQGERPDEPQVPLYVIANRDKVAGAALGIISSDSVTMSGIADDGDIAPAILACDALNSRYGFPEKWPELIEYWQSNLLKIADEFVSGNAAVDPKKPGQTCNYCELKSFCRVAELQEYLEESQGGVKE